MLLLRKIRHGFIIFFLISTNLITVVPLALASEQVGLYSVFETQVANSRNYSNPFDFSEIELRATFISPSGKEISFFGFYDGDGNGGQTGNIWKIRFMPDELGVWNYVYTWSDRTAGGSGQFNCVAEGARKGILKAYKANPRWFAYNGDTPVFLRSYYLNVSSLTGTPISWAVENIYQKLLNRGYNHISLVCLPIAFTWKNYADAPPFLSGRLYQGDTPSQAMDLTLWKSMEEHVDWLNKHDVGIYLFQGLDGQNEGDFQDQGVTRWHNLSQAEKEFLVHYVCARLAPYANIAGWNYTWETCGRGGDLELMGLLIHFDPWGHLRTYHRSYTCSSHEYSNSEYTFAAVENFAFGDPKGSKSHHDATLAYYAGKPVYMVEGGGLWTSCYGASENDIRRAAWGVTTAGGSFTWMSVPGCGHGYFTSDDIFATLADEYIDILNDILTNDIVFHKMTPHDELLSSFSGSCFCLAEIGSQYLVYKELGGTFSLNLASGTYNSTWINTKNNSREVANRGTITDSNSDISFATPDTTSDWVLVITYTGSLGNRPPIAKISADVIGGEAPLTVNFDGSQSIDYDGFIESYAWDFGDGKGNTSTDSVTTYTYTSAGEFKAILTVTDNDGATGTDTVTILALVTGVEDQNLTGIPEEYDLSQNYPNPFNPETHVKYQIPVSTHVEIKIFNVLGEEIITLVDEDKEAGYYTVTWNGKDSSGNGVSSGIYLYQIRTRSFVKMKRMPMLR